MLKMLPADESTVAVVLPRVVAAAIVILCSSAYYYYYFYYYNYKVSRRSNTNSNVAATAIPMAPNAIPLLGHALLYKANPVEYLKQCRQSLGPIFTLNMAGRHMILVCGGCGYGGGGEKELRQLQEQLANMPESVLSARQAVADLGFEHTLGLRNVHEGTTLHKGIIKGYMTTMTRNNNNKNNNSNNTKQASIWIDAMRRSMQQELSDNHDNNNNNMNNIPTKKEKKVVVELFHFTRRVMLRTTIDVLIGSAFLQDWNDFDFLQEFMKFQDTLEDVTAKSVILPKPLALVWMLWPLQRKRIQLQGIIQTRLDTILSKKATNNIVHDDDDDDNSIGFWLQAVLEQGYDHASIAEFIVGLLFAAHKNPAIAAAQSYLMLQEHLDSNAKQQCIQEARAFLDKGDSNNSFDLQRSSSSSSSSMLYRVCLESLRLTAHSIGAVRTVQQDVTVQTNDSNNNNNNQTIYHIPKGSNLAFSHIVPNTCTEMWGNNGTHFSLHHALQKYQNDYAFTTFSHGVHKCPGQELATKHLIMGALALWLTEYPIDIVASISSSPVPVPPLSFERATLAQRMGPVPVQIQHCGSSKNKLVVE
jgi:cytochrome P450